MVQDTGLGHGKGLPSLPSPPFLAPLLPLPSLRPPNSVPVDGVGSGRASLSSHPSLPSNPISPIPPPPSASNNDNIKPCRRASASACFSSTASSTVPTPISFIRYTPCVSCIPPCVSCLPCVSCGTGDFRACILGYACRVWHSRSGDSSTSTGCIEYLPASIVCIERICFGCIGGCI